MPSLNAIYKLSQDPDFLERLTVAAAKSGETNPAAWAQTNALTCVNVMPDAATKYQEKIDDPYRYNPASDPAIISDTQITGMVNEVMKRAREAAEKAATQLPQDLSPDSRMLGA